MLKETPKLAQRISKLPLNIQLEIVREVNDFLERQITLFEHLQKVVDETKVDAKEPLYLARYE
jgi:hypothetical protein